MTYKSKPFAFRCPTCNKTYKARLEEGADGIRRTVELGPAEPEDDSLLRQCDPCGERQEQDLIDLLRGNG